VRRFPSSASRLQIPSLEFLRRRAERAELIDSCTGGREGERRKRLGEHLVEVLAWGGTGGDVRIETFAGSLLDVGVSSCNHTFVAKQDATPSMRYRNRQIEVAHDRKKYTCGQAGTEVARQTRLLTCRPASLSWPFNRADGISNRPA
jgi:hypothetical protein